MSLRSALGAFHAISGSRGNAKGEISRDFIADRIFCWRRARVRSDSLGLHSLWRVRASASACLPLIWVLPFFRRSV